MNARHSHSSAPGPDLLARYLNAYLQARQLSDAERPWGLGDDALDALWARLSEAMSDPQKLDKLVAEELSKIDRQRIVETLVPLIFALPLRSYPAELRAMRQGPRLVLSLRHLPTHSGSQGADAKHETPRKDQPQNGSESACATPPSSKKDSGRKPACKDSIEKEKDKGEHIDSVGFLPAALTEPFAEYLRGVLHWPQERHWCVVTISSGGRRRRVRVTVLSKGRGVVVRFLERLPSPIDEPAK